MAEPPSPNRNDDPLLSDTTTTSQTHTLTLDLSPPYPLTLPLIPLKPDLAIALLMIIDHPISLCARAGAALAALLAPLCPDVVVAPATLGIPVGIEVSRALGLERYVVLQKSPKVHLSDALSQPIESITSKGAQRLLLDRHAAAPLLSGGRRVVVVDDVVASGSSLRGALALVRRAGGNVVGVGAILTETWAWKDVLGEEDSKLVRSLGHIPQFQKGEGGQWIPIPGT
ncbi:phosphoribosyltransferase-like protein [Xylariales sp. PMI_506]|nr:phosphoribosyltransferase-like protein [Xylariales sp. PMI_506]